MAQNDDDTVNLEMAAATGEGGIAVVDNVGGDAGRGGGLSATSSSGVSKAGLVTGSSLVATASPATIATVVTAIVVTVGLSAALIALYAPVDFPENASLLVNSTISHIKDTGTHPTIIQDSGATTIPDVTSVAGNTENSDNERTTKSATGGNTENFNKERTTKSATGGNTENFNKERTTNSATGGGFGIDRTTISGSTEDLTHKISSLFGMTEDAVSDSSSNTENPATHKSTKSGITEDSTSYIATVGGSRGNIIFGGSTILGNTIISGLTDHTQTHTSSNADNTEDVVAEGSTDSGKTHSVSTRFAEIAGGSTLSSFIWSTGGKTSNGQTDDGVTEIIPCSEGASMLVPTQTAAMWFPCIPEDGEEFAPDCAYVMGNESRICKIKPAQKNESVDVFCDFDIDGTGWTVFQRRVNGSEDFYRYWDDYVAGFGQLDGEFWMGLEVLSLLTQQMGYVLRVDMEVFSDGSPHHAMYDCFYVEGNSSNYTLRVGTYVSNSSDAGDSMRLHDGMMFTTRDRDNDIFHTNCGEFSNGGFWYSSCGSNPNGLYEAAYHNNNGIYWYSLFNDYTRLRYIQMAIQPGGTSIPGSTSVQGNTGNSNIEITTNSVTGEAFAIDRTTISGSTEDFTHKISSLSIGKTTEDVVTEIIPCSAGASMLVPTQTVPMWFPCIPEDGEEFAPDCAYVMGNESRICKIKPAQMNESVDVFCDFDIDGTGWTVFQRRVDGSVGFFRDWEDYVAGFGQLEGEFWMGLEVLSLLTQQMGYVLRVDMEVFSDGSPHHAMYDCFYVEGNSSNYILRVGTYVSNSSDAGDSLRPHDGMMFSTKDRDNDIFHSSCAVASGGGFWYYGCGSNPNGLYGSNRGTAGIYWFALFNDYIPLRYIQMAIQPAS